MNLLLLQDEYMTFTRYDVKNKKFYFAKGGGYSFEGNTLVVRCEFSSADNSEVGKELKFAFERQGNRINVRDRNETFSLELSDSSTTPLSGCWRINGRMQNGKLSEMPLRSRRTLKILTGTHFQWMAINIATREFSGCGGGRYEFINGKYTEHIDYFSRDSSRVGMSLSFNGEVKNGIWNHSGTSSKGDPVHETWTLYHP